MKIKLIKAGIITSMCLASGFLFSANAADASTPVGEIRTTKMDNCINDYLKKGYIKVDGLKYHDNNTTTTDDDVMFQLLKNEEKKEYRNKAQSFKATTSVIGHPHSFNTEDSNSKSKVWGSYFSASGGVSAEGKVFGFGFELNLSVTYGKDITSSITSTELRGVEFDFVVDCACTYTLYQYVSGYDYVILGFKVSDCYRNVATKDKNGNVTGYNRVFDYSEWTLSNVQEFSSNNEDYFYVEKE